MNFKNWLYLERNNNYLINLLNKSYNFLLFLYSKELLKENGLIQQVPEELLSNFCGIWCKWIKKFNPNFKSNPDNEFICGSEGCALFAGNGIVVKFTNKQEEAKIASLIKGNANFPVLDVVRYNNVYAIAMKQLKSISFAGQMAKSIRGGKNLVVRFLTEIDQYDNLNNKFNEWIKSLQEKLQNEELEFAFKLIYLIEIIKNETGNLIGHDWGYHNLGLNDKNEIQPFDFGRSTQLDSKKIEIPNLN